MLGGKQEDMNSGNNNDLAWPPWCWCRSGPMVILQSGTVKNQGRFFYKCPRNLSHPNSFIWCDIWHQNDPPHLLPHFLKNNNATDNSGLLQPSSSSTSSFSHITDHFHDHMNESSAYPSVTSFFIHLLGVWVNKYFCKVCVVMVIWSIFVACIGFFLGRLSS